ncbi:lysozyme g-like [Ambystoma mexicanum]|uniref:Lysozyme g n=1 Tax=Ambystoma mexicanum TaxID=8296 RepID=G8I0D0_AMBME|nr:G-type lysozyme [Ambystoma mexicanum]
MLALLSALCLAGSIGLSAASGCYGNIMDVPTTGASCLTASQDNLPYCGVAASQQMAATDLPDMNQYKEKILAVAQNLCMDGAVIAGIISRESRAGAVLQNGWGDNGHAFGLMQIDIRWHSIEGAWNSQENINEGTGILINMIVAISDKFPSWSVNDNLKGGIAAYNAGPGNIYSYSQVDQYTTDGDYSNDVVARAQYYKTQGY